MLEVFTNVDPESMFAVGLPFDVSELSVHEAGLRRVENELGPLTTLVNNAGVGVMQRSNPLDVEIGNRVRVAGMQAVGPCRAPYLVGKEVPHESDCLRSAIDMAAELGALVPTVVTGATEPGTKGVFETQRRLSERVAEAATLAGAAEVSLTLEPLN